MHELGAPPGGPERQVVGVDGDHVQAARGRVEGDPGAGHARGRRRAGRPCGRRWPRRARARGVRRSAPVVRRRAGPAHGARYRSMTLAQLGVEVGHRRPPVSVIVGRRQREPVGGEQHAAGQQRRVADPHRAVPLPLLDPSGRAARGSPPGCGRAGRAGRAAAARGRRARILANRALSRSAATVAATPGRRSGAGPGRRPGATSVHPGPLAGHQVGEQRLHVGPAAVERHPRDAGAAGHVGERGPPPAHGQDAPPARRRAGRRRRRGRPRNDPGVTKWTSCVTL